VSDGSRFVARSGSRTLSFDAQGVHYELRGASALFAPTHLFAFGSPETPARVAPRERGVEQIEYAREGFDEHWTLSGDRAEQSWRFLMRPHRGNVSVRVPVHGLRYTGGDESGLWFETTHRDRVHYSHGVFRDARGRRTEILAHFDAAEKAIALDLPGRLLDESAYPAELDPTISAVLSTSDAATNHTDMDLAWSPGQNRYLLSFFQQSGTTPHVYSVRFGAEGDVADGAPLLTSTSSNEKTRLRVLGTPAGWIVSWMDRRNVNANSYTYDLLYRSVLSSLGPSATKQQSLSWAYDSVLTDLGVSFVGYASYGTTSTWYHEIDRVAAGASSSQVEKLATVSGEVAGVLAEGDLTVWWMASGSDPGLYVFGDRGVIHYETAPWANGRALASNGSGVYLFTFTTTEAAPSENTLRALLLDAHGSALVAPLDLGPLDAIDSGTAVAWDGTHFVILAGGKVSTSVYRISADGHIVDPAPEVVLQHAYGERRKIVAASDGAGHVLMAYRLTSQGGATIETRLLDFNAPGDRAQGAACSSGFSCATGLCVDGVCCDSACGYGSADDCQACSISAGAPHDGECTLLDSSQECRVARGACDVTEVCSGTSPECPADIVRPTQTPCGAAATDVCDVDDVCDGVSPQCRIDARKRSGVECRAPRDACDAAEHCDGSSAACPVDAARPSSSVCRPAAAPCDAVERCDGVSDACPPDGVASARVTCRAAASDCDAAEVCDGTLPTCPTDAPASAGVMCRDAAGPCDTIENCNGVTFTCPSDTFSQGTSCRPPAADCDAEEYCDGSGPHCPPDAPAQSSQVCRGATGACDAEEHCTGDSPICPVDSYQAQGSECRLAVGLCDVAEVCTGTSRECPTDAVELAGVVCRLERSSCDPAELCDGVNTACPDDIGCAPPHESFIPATLPPQEPRSAGSSGDTIEDPPNAYQEPPVAPSSGGCSARGTGSVYSHWWLLLAFGTLLRAARRSKWALRGLAACGLMACDPDPADEVRRSIDAGSHSKSDAAASPESWRDASAGCDRDSDCPAVAYCDKFDHACAVKGVEGRRCDAKRCVDGTFCAADDRCAPRKMEGEACSEAMPCLEALACLEGSCAQVAGRSQPCRIDRTCDVGLACIDEVCRKPGVLGEPCLPQRACDSRLSCVDNSCVEQGWELQACLPAGLCHGQLTCVAEVCLAAGEQGGPCENGTTCSEGLYCHSEHLCRPLQDYGTACVDAKQCASGHCEVPLANASTGAKTCVRNDSLSTLDADPQQSCATAGWDEPSHVIDGLCTTPRCLSECAACLVSARHPYVAYAYCSL